MALAPAAVAKNIKLTGVVESLGHGANLQHCGGVRGGAGYAKSVALFEGKKRVGTFNFQTCQSPGTEISYGGTGSLTVGKITGKVQAGLVFSALPSFAGHRYNRGHLLKNSVHSTNEELFYVTGSASQNLPSKIGAQVTFILIPKLVPNT